VTKKTKGFMTFSQVPLLLLGICRRHLFHLAAVGPKLRRQRGHRPRRRNDRPRKLHSQPAPRKVDQEEDVGENQVSHPQFRQMGSPPPFLAVFCPAETRYFLIKVLH